MVLAFYESTLLLEHGDLGHRPAGVDGGLGLPEVREGVLLYPEHPNPGARAAAENKRKDNAISDKCKNCCFKKNIYTPDEFRVRWPANKILENAFYYCF